jgi:ABC-2 type transport system ATP-binding protein
MAAAGHTIFFSSHTLSEVEQLCDRVAMVRHGMLVADESLDELRAHAGHQVNILWKDNAAASAPPPPFLILEKREGLTWIAMLEGSVERLMAWLAGRGVEDLSIGRPDLESLFRRYYESD